jgi:hypothetical protein
VEPFDYPTVGQRPERVRVLFSHGLALSTFQNWRRRLASERGPAFVEVTSASPVASAGAQAFIELCLPRGVVARVRPGFDALLRSGRVDLPVLRSAACVHRPGRQRANGLHAGVAVRRRTC